MKKPYISFAIRIRRIAPLLHASLKLAQNRLASDAPSLSPPLPRRAPLMSPPFFSPLLISPPSRTAPPLPLSLVGTLLVFSLDRPPFSLPPRPSFFFLAAASLSFTLLLLPEGRSRRARTALMRKMQLAACIDVQQNGRRERKNEKEVAGRGGGGNRYHALP